MKKSIVGLLLVGFFLVVGCVSKKQSSDSAGRVLTTTGRIENCGKEAVFSKTTSAPNKAFIGVILDEQDRKIMERTNPRTVERIDKSEPLTVSDIIKLSQGGINDETIIRYIRNTNTTYNLSESQVKRLQQGGVSQRVVNYLVETGR
jgi:hypothetical protein